jgi:hypothetical protein
MTEGDELIVDKISELETKIEETEIKIWEEKGTKEKEQAIRERIAQRKDEYPEEFGRFAKITRRTTHGVLSAISYPLSLLSNVTRASGKTLTTL